jgi:D-alanine-D-alanine ligase
MLVKKIAVLMGGWSSEREVSLNSGQNVVHSLTKMGFDVCAIDVKKDLCYITEELYRVNPDFIFNILHGFGGEDGIIQGVLDLFGVPYSNSGVLSSSIAFNKTICKKIVKSVGVRTIDGFDISKEEIKYINVVNGIAIKYPFVVKPASNGSSIGVFLIFNVTDLDNLKDTEWSFGNEVIVEKYIEGREFTVLVIDGKAIGAVEIVSKNKFYDFESKYEIGGSEHIATYDLEQSTKQEMFEMATKAFEVCFCKGIARIDFRYDGRHMYFLEINTQPGMTKLSLVPDIAAANGMSMEQLLELTIKSSLKNKR